MIPVGVFEGRRVAVFGLAKSGVAAGKALLAGGAEVVAWDDDAAVRETAVAAGIPLLDLSSADWSQIAALVLAPGVPLTHPAPHWSVELAHEAGVEVIGDTELFFRERARLASRARVIGITGTNGKSTTSALVDHLLAFCGHKSVLGGNIGTAILDLEPLGDDMTYVIELSSYQLDLTPSLALSVGALLNLAPDHLDRHGDFANYSRIKAGIFRNIEPGGCAVVGVDDAPSTAIADALQEIDEVRRISVKDPVASGVFARDGALFEVADGREEPPVPVAGIGSLRGKHNCQNAAAAFAVARACGLKAADIAAGLQTFPGLAHRMEDVARRGQTLFVNDSKATNTDAAARALACFDAIYWIVGGRAKADGLAGLEPYFPKVRRAYLIGEAAEKFADDLDGRVDSRIVETLENAVAAAARDAQDDAAGEAVVLLSPACVSFDQFANFAVRGDAFRAAVAELAGVVMNPGASA